MENYMTVDEFAFFCHKKRQTILKNLNKIKGVVFINEIPYILKGSRYPYNKRNSLFKTYDKKFNGILKAINQNLYIDNITLQIEENEFNDILKELLKFNFIKLNSSINKYGCNMYSMTKEGSDYLKSIGLKKKGTDFIENITANTIAIYLDKKTRGI